MRSLLAVFLVMLLVQVSCAQNADTFGSRFARITARLESLSAVAGSFPPSVDDSLELEETITLYDSIGSDLEALVGDSPDSVCVRTALGDLHRMGHNLDIPGAWEEAERNLKQAIASAPDAPEAYYTLGLLYVNSDLHLAPRAEDLFDQALEKSNGHPDPYIYQGLAFARILQGENREAHAAIEEFLRLKPGDARGSRLRDIILQRLEGESQPALLAVGDSLSPYLERHPVKYRIRATDIMSWKEGKDVSILAYQREVDTTRPAFFEYRGIPFGVLQGNPPNAYCLFDTDGDGILDYQSDEGLFPIWLMWQFTSSLADPDSPEFTRTLDLFFEGFQSNQGVFDNADVYPAFDLLHRGAADTLLPNRDLFYALWYYTTFTSRDPRQALMAIKTLHRAYSDRFGHSHPIFPLYELESSLQSGDAESAAPCVEELRRLRPDFIPAQYYDCILHHDSADVSRCLTTLRALYPDHWLIRAQPTDHED